MSLLQSIKSSLQVLPLAITLISSLTWTKPNWRLPIYLLFWIQKMRSSFRFERSLKCWQGGSLAISNFKTWHLNMKVASKMSSRIWTSKLSLAKRWPLLVRLGAENQQLCSCYSVFTFPTRAKLLLTGLISKTIISITCAVNWEWSVRSPFFSTVLFDKILNTTNTTLLKMKSEPLPKKQTHWPLFKEIKNLSWKNKNKKKRERDLTGMWESKGHIFQEDRSKGSPLPGQYSETQKFCSWTKPHRP